MAAPAPNRRRELVGPLGFEPRTRGLKVPCSTAELRAPPNSTPCGATAAGGRGDRPLEVPLPVEDPERRPVPVREETWIDDSATGGSRRGSEGADHGLVGSLVADGEPEHERACRDGVSDQRSPAPIAAGQGEAARLLESLAEVRECTFIMMGDLIEGLCIPRFRTGWPRCGTSVPSVPGLLAHGSLHEGRIGAPDRSRRRRCADRATGRPIAHGHQPWDRPSRYPPNGRGGVCDGGPRPADRAAQGALCTPADCMFTTVCRPSSLPSSPLGVINRPASAASSGEPAHPVVPAT